MYDVVALGESLIDFTPAGTNEQGLPLFSQNPGGAPANVLAMNAKLGGSTAFIGKVGQDDFGRFLKSTMERAGINCRGLCRDPKIPTTLAFVQLDEYGDRSFTFYRKPGADLLLCPEELPRELLTDCRVFHFGSVSLTGNPSRQATRQAAKTAKAAGALLSFDPNYRPLLWESEEEARTEILRAVQLADLLKVSGEELLLLTGTDDLNAGAAQLAALGPTAVLVTLGPDGAFFLTPAGSGLLPAYDLETADTNGAGDAFVGALLACLAAYGENALHTMTKQNWSAAVAFANAAGSLTTTAKGAIPAMPNREQIEWCMAEIPTL